MCQTQTARNETTSSFCSRLSRAAFLKDSFNIRKQQNQNGEQTHSCLSLSRASCIPSLYKTPYIYICIFIFLALPLSDVQRDHRGCSSACSGSEARLFLLPRTTRFSPRMSACANPAAGSEAEAIPLTSGCDTSSAAVRTWRSTLSPTTTHAVA